MCANPTGPVTAASGRGAAFGDALAALLAHSGHAVEREYYLNDAGSQVRLFAESIAARMRGAEPPEDGYAGEYVAELGAELAAGGADADDLDALERLGTEAMRVRIQATLERFGVDFDTWSSERELRESGALERTLDACARAGTPTRARAPCGCARPSSATTRTGCSSAPTASPPTSPPTSPTTSTSCERGHERLINVLGADHHGYVPRMRAALAALDFDPERFEALIMQMVNIVEGGQRARMSKRRGDFVTLEELMDDIGVDATRFFILQRSHDTALDLDLELARSASQDNPVYYVQYAHARVASILRKAADEGVAASADEIASRATPGGAGRGRGAGRTGPGAAAARAAGRGAHGRGRRAPHRICAYAMATAADFHAFYRDCRVVGRRAGRRGRAPRPLRGDDAHDRDHARAARRRALRSACRQAAWGGRR